MNTSAALLEYYESHLRSHGDTARGAAWPDDDGRNARFQAGLDIILAHARRQPVTVCDLGCGTGELYRYIHDRGLRQIAYLGVDRSAAAIKLAKLKFPGVPFHCVDTESCAAGELDEVFDCDFVFANGLFTVKHSATQQDMWGFMTRMIETAWTRARRGIVFNVMSKAVDWERDDLFHVSYDELATFLHGLAGRHIGFKADYGLYELMAYALKPQAAASPMPPLAGPAAAERTMAVCRPLLPRAESILPFLSLADQNRHYSNHGMLVQRLTQGLESAIGTGAHSVCLASSGTAALTGAILALAGRAGGERPLALCPAYTFVATALAAELTGYQPHLADVDAASWALTPAAVRAHPSLDRVGLVVVTAPYGQPVRQAEWSAFYRETGIPVVIDAAAAFEGACAAPQDHVGDIPVALSLHATKAFSTAEGGAVVCTDRKLLDRVYGALNFGFLGTRECRAAGMNGKMSEYHAAVGLAELQSWDVKQAGFGRASAAYRRIAAACGLDGRIVTAPRIGSCYALFVARDGSEAGAVQRSLQLAGIDFRRWYGSGLHREPYFRTAPRDDALANTDRLARCILGLPMAPDLTEAEVRRVVAAIARGLAQAGGMDALRERGGSRE